MRIISMKEDGALRIALEGELDHHAARSAIARITALIEAELPRTVIFNLRGLSFMDSSGIALMIHTHRSVSELSGKLVLEEVPAQAYKVLHAAGIDTLIPTARTAAR